MGQTTALQPGQADLGAGGIQFGGVIEQLGLRVLAAPQSTEEGGAGGGSRQLPDDVREQQIRSTTSPWSGRGPNLPPSTVSIRLLKL